MTRGITSNGTAVNWIPVCVCVWLQERVLPLALLYCIVTCGAVIDCYKQCTDGWGIRVGVRVITFVDGT